MAIEYKRVLYNLYYGENYKHWSLTFLYVAEVPSSNHPMSVALTHQAILTPTHPYTGFSLVTSLVLALCPLCTIGWGLDWHVDNPECMWIV